MKDLREFVIGGLLWLIIAALCLLILTAEAWSLFKFIGLFF